MKFEEKRLLRPIRQIYMNRSHRRQPKDLVWHRHMSINRYFLFPRRNSNFLNLRIKKPNNPLPIRCYVYPTHQTTNPNPSLTLTKNFKGHSKGFKLGLKCLQHGLLEVSHQSFCDCGLVYPFM